MVEQFRRLVAPVLRMVRMMVGRAVVNLVNDGLKMQELQLTLLADEVRADVERFQEYGFTSHPVPGAEAVMVSVGGSRDHGIVISVDDRRYRLKGLSRGEVALYDNQGQAIHLKRNKTIHVYGCDHLTVDASEDVQVNTKLAAVTASESAQISAPAVTMLTDALNVQTLGGGGHAATLTGNFSITGSLAVNGPISATGDITSDGSIIDTAGNTNHHSH